MTLTSRLEDWAHPALTVLPWEHAEADRVGVHGRALWAKGRREDYGPVYISVDCYCGWTSGDCDTNEEAFDALVAHALQARKDAADCTCVFTCAEDPKTACSLSGTWHVHPHDGLGIFGPCPEHPDAPGDL